MTAKGEATVLALVLRGRVQEISDFQGNAGELGVDEESGAAVRRCICHEITNLDKDYGPLTDCPIHDDPDAIEGDCSEETRQMLEADFFEHRR